MFIEIVGCSKLLVDEQREKLAELNSIVRSTETFRGGQPEKAFEWLHRATDEHSSLLEALPAGLEFRALDGDPRFKELLRRMNLATDGTQLNRVRP